MHIDPRKFKDRYDSALKKLVRKKARGGTIEAPEPEKKADNEINLMDALRASLGKGKRAAPRRRRKPERRAA